MHLRSCKKDYHHQENVQAPFIPTLSIIIIIITIIDIIITINIIIIVKRMCRLPLLFPPLQTPTRLVLFQDHVEKPASVVFKRRKRGIFSSFLIGVKHRGD